MIRNLVSHDIKRELERRLPRSPNASNAVVLDHEVVVAFWQVDAREEGEVLALSRDCDLLVRLVIDNGQTHQVGTLRVLVDACVEDFGNSIDLKR